MEFSAARFPPQVAHFLGYDETDTILLTIGTFSNPTAKIMEVLVSFYWAYEFRFASRLSRIDGSHRVQV